MSAHQILFAKSAKKDIQKLDLQTRKRLKQKFTTFILDPLPHSKKLINSKIGTHRWRVGSYRVIFDLDSKKQEILILRVRHRKEVYKC